MRKKEICGKLTSSKPDLCRKHSGTYYVTQYFNKLQYKARKTEMLEEARMLEDAKLLEDARKLEEGG